MATILLVDDEAALVKVLKEALALQLPDADVRTASTWAEAVEAAAGLASIELLIVDHHLGSHTGIELCEHLLATHPAMRTIVYTGKATSDVEAAARAVGARVLWKPQRLTRLLDEVRAALVT